MEETVITNVCASVFTHDDLIMICGIFRYTISWKKKNYKRKIVCTCFQMEKSRLYTEETINREGEDMNGPRTLKEQRWKEFWK